MRTVIGIVPGVKLSGLAVIRAHSPRHPAPQSWLELAVEVRDPATLAELLSGIRDQAHADPAHWGIPLVLIADVAADPHHEPGLAELKVQGFCEGIGKALGLLTQRRPPLYPTHDGLLWSQAWWELTTAPSLPDIGGERTVPNQLVIAALALARQHLASTR